MIVTSDIIFIFVVVCQHLRSQKKLEGMDFNLQIHVEKMTIKTHESENL